MQQHLHRYPVHLSSPFDLASQILQHPVEVRHRSLQIRHLRRTIRATDKKCARIPQHALHMANQLQRRTDVRTRTKPRELGRRIP